ncbi:MAG: diacylglycerol kinase [Conchiformibius sp.]|nr:diacylglycerol kinase [Conchiformibius sp.]
MNGESGGKPGKKGLERIICAAAYSKDGFQAAFRYEAAFRQLLALHAVLLLCVWLPDFDTATRMVLVAASFVSLITELFNTAIEAVVDYISLEKHPLAKRAKDVGSAAQFTALLMTAMLWATALAG